MQRYNSEQLTKQDLKQVVDLYIHCFNDPEKGEDWTVESATKYFEERSAEASIFYVERDSDKNICGVIVASPYEKSFISRELEQSWSNAYYISLVATQKSLRKKGLAMKLMDFFVNDMENKLVDSVVVRCRSENIPVQMLFKKNNFEEALEYESTLGGVTCRRKILHKIMGKNQNA